MTLDRDKLRQTLAELHAQLDAADTVDADLAAQLRAAASEIGQTLNTRSAANRSSDGDDEPATPSISSTPEVLEDAALQFEQSHPTIAGTVRQLIDVLAQMGI